jgi:hypothetical protein
MTVKIEILNPKAKKLLNDLADLKLIAITEEKEESFMDIVKRMRLKAKKSPVAMSEITKEVEKVRASRYAKKKR